MPDDLTRSIWDGGANCMPLLCPGKQVHPGLLKLNNLGSTELKVELLR
jgi:hypothetical protein